MTVIEAARPSADRLEPREREPGWPVADMTLADAPTAPARRLRAAPSEARPPQMISTRALDGRSRVIKVPSGTL